MKVRPINRCLLVITLSAVFIAGCRRAVDIAGSDPDYYYLNKNRNLENVGRVAFIEFENKTDFPDIHTTVADSLLAQIQNKHLFGVDYIAGDDVRWKNLSLQADQNFTLEQIVQIRKSLGTNAILSGAITMYQPYPHMKLGIRIKLIDLDENRLLWAVENVWDSSDKKTQARIADYFSRQHNPSYAPWYQKMTGENIHQRLVSVSPKQYAEFIAFEICRTLDKN